MRHNNKFRGKSKNGQWVYGNLITTKHECFIFNEYFLPAKSIPRRYFIDVDPETVGQFTEMYDKYGKEIYEGDIVTADWHWHNGKIVDLYFEERFMWAVSEFHLEDQLYILGNKHDNPELKT